MNKHQIESGYRKAKAEILEERDHCCESCGTTSKFLTPSHLISRNDANVIGHPELIIDKKNIRIHCIDCHQSHEIGKNKGSDHSENNNYFLELHESGIIPDWLLYKHTKI